MVTVDYSVPAGAAGASAVRVDSFFDRSGFDRAICQKTAIQKWRL